MELRCIANPRCLGNSDSGIMLPSAKQGITRLGRTGVGRTGSYILPILIIQSAQGRWLVSWSRKLAADHCETTWIVC